MPVDGRTVQGKMYPIIDRLITVSPEWSAPTKIRIVNGIPSGSGMLGGTSTFNYTPGVEKTE